MTEYLVELGSSAVQNGKTFKAQALSLKEAQQIVRTFIEENDLTAGCSSYSDAFTGGDLYLEDGKTKIGKISYNGRAWDLDGKELVG